MVILNTSCKKEDKKCPTDFVVYGKVLPYAETYKVGDTLTLEAKYSNMIYERNTEQYYDMKGLDIKSILYILKIDTAYDNNYVSGVLEYVEIVNNNSFNYSIQYFSDGGSELFSNILFDGSYFFHQIKIILSKKGDYMITYGPSTVDNNFEFDGKCNNRTFDLNTRLNQEKNNNINLLELSPDKHFNTWVLQKPEERFYNGRFAYRVIE
jgi:hypothetical protein